MDNEKYTNSFIDSVYDFLEKLQYLGRNDPKLVKTLALFKIFHWLYSWADWYEITEANKIKLEELINCLIMRNSDLVLPYIEAQSFYSNVNSPQNMWTWRILETNGVLQTVTSLGNKIVTFTSSPSLPISLIINKPDVDENQNGITTFTRTYPINEVITVTVPWVSPTGKLFSHLTINSITSESTNNVFTVVVDNPKTVTVFYTDPQPPLGSIKLTKEVLNSVEDNTEFTVVVKKIGTPLQWTKTIINGQEIGFNQLEMGAYTVEELPTEGYTMAASFSVLLEVGDLQNYEGILQNTKDEAGSITVTKQTSIETQESFDIGIFEEDTPENILYATIQVNVPYTFTNLPFGTYYIEEYLYIGPWIPTITPHEGSDEDLGVVTLDAENPTEEVLIVNNWNG